MALVIKKDNSKEKGTQFQDMEDYKTRHRHGLDVGITNYSQEKVKMSVNEEEQLKANRE